MVLSKYLQKKVKPEEALFLEQGQPLVFGAAKDKGIKLDGLRPVVVHLGDGISPDDLWIHDENDFYKAQILTRMFDDPQQGAHFPRPFGVFYQTERACYEDEMQIQIDETIATKGYGDLDKLLRGKEVWDIAG